MDARDRTRHRRVQIKEEGTEEPLSPPYRKNVRWQIKLLPFSYTGSHFTSSVNNLCGTYLDWPAVCSKQAAKLQYPKQNKKLKLYEGVIVNLFYLCCFLFYNSQFWLWRTCTHAETIYCIPAEVCWHRSPSTVLHVFLASWCASTFFRDLTELMTYEGVVFFQVGELMFLCLRSAVFVLLHRLGIR